MQLTLSVTVMLILLYLLFTTKKWYWFPFFHLPILLIINFGIFDKIILTEESISEKRLFSAKTFLFKDIKEIRLKSSNKNIGFIMFGKVKIYKPDYCYNATRGDTIGENALFSTNL